MEYQVILIIDGKRETLIFEHVKEEYGVSESEFWCCWIGNQPHFEGDGDTPEEAIQNLIKNREKIEKVKKQFEASLGERFANTPIFDYATYAADLVVQQQQHIGRMMRRGPA